MLTSELGSKEDYEREYGDTPFRILDLAFAVEYEANVRTANDVSYNTADVEGVISEYI